MPNARKGGHRNLTRPRTPRPVNSSPRSITLTADTPAARAHELILVADGVEAAGMTDLAHRARVVANDVLELNAHLTAERSARRAIQQRHTDYVAHHHAHCFNPDGTARTEPAAAEDIVWKT